MGKSVSNAFTKGSFAVKSGNSIQVVIFSGKTFETEHFFEMIWFVSSEVKESNNISKDSDYADHSKFLDLSEPYRFS